MREKNQYSLLKEKRDKGYTLLFIAFIIVLLIAIGLIALFITANAKNEKLKEEIALKNWKITQLKDEVIKSRDIIAEYDALSKRLYAQIDEHISEKSKLLALVNFLTPWATKIADRLEKTVDFRSLTIINCDDIACWLFEQVKKYREWKAQNETKKN